jgi:hypothetical protein
MNEETSQPAGANAPMQFERAEFAPGATLKCALCQAPIVGEYFLANNQPVCSSCRGKVEAIGTGGSGAVRFARAAGAGVVAAIGGFIVYYLVLTITNINFSLIAILVGWMVGYAVRWGSYARGGPVYQALALALTYVAICANYVPGILRYSNLRSSGETSVMDVIAAIGRSLTVPFDVGLGILGYVIMGFGLYQAWIMNRASAVQITGPFQAQAPVIQV